MDTNEMDPHSPWQLKVFFVLFLHYCKYQSHLAASLIFLLCPVLSLLSFCFLLGTTFLLPLFVYLVCRLLCFLVSSILFSTALAVVFPAFCPFRPNYFGWGSTCMQRICHIYTYIHIHRYASMYIKLGCLWSDSCQLLWWHSYQLCVAHTLLPFCFPPIFFFFFLESVRV